MRTPINGARLSSGFGKRRHPILGYTKMHRGLILLLLEERPFMLPEMGVVVQAVTVSSGHYIRIRHNSDFETAYAHLSWCHAYQRAKMGQPINKHWTALSTPFIFVRATPNFARNRRVQPAE